jgi:2-methylisocitrate lyase-like PEP mutase family enzyme
MADSRLRKLAGERRAALVPGVYSALTARQAELAGFEAVYATGAGIANSLLAAPDLGLTSFKEVLDQVQYIVDAVEVPVIVDADTGFGNALSVRRVVRALERVGAAAAQLEDQEFPKRCGHFDGKRVVLAEEMLGKIKAALDARTSDQFLIVARTDARAELGLEEALERAERYAQAGADIIFVEAPLDLDEYAEVTRRIRVPCLANLVEGGKGVAPTQAQLRELGYGIALHANIALRAAMRATGEILAYLRGHGTPAGAEDRFASWEERQRLVRLDEHQALERRYAAVERVRGQIRGELDAQG